MRMQNETREEYAERKNREDANRIILLITLFFGLIIGACFVRVFVMGL